MWFIRAGYNTQLHFFVIFYNFYTHQGFPPTAKIKTKNCSEDGTGIGRTQFHRDESTIVSISNRNELSIWFSIVVDGLLVCYSLPSFMCFKAIYGAFNADSFYLLFIHSFFLKYSIWLVWSVKCVRFICVFVFTVYCLHSIYSIFELPNTHQKSLQSVISVVWIEVMNSNHCSWI